MALFQHSVLKDQLRLQDEQQVNIAYKKFTSFFHNPDIQENIRSSKEEQFQATFLTELFVKVLGYTMNPQPEYNLTTEFKNQKNARKADGAILKEGQAIGVIELKGTNTKHLEGIRQQAFDYKANQKGCVYVITSNFEKLRFYINDATEFVEFDLFELNREDFSLLWLCLHRENLLSGKPSKIKEASVVEEEVITKQFYKDYSVFKRELYRDLVKRNAKRLRNSRPPGYESDAQDAEARTEMANLEKNVKQNLFKKSQKLIDRFLFIFFAEDRALLPPNSIHKILSDWNKLKDLDAEMPLYDRFKLYFGYLDSGRKGTDKKAEIFAYNGGLFKPDPVLDMLEIDDELLYKYTSRLATYDFESQVDVNILGHIFENSLNEIESVNAEIEGASFDKQKSKRKKDGVFYTPKYITKYIVENTIGKLCEEKKSELGFREEEYFRGRKRRQKDTLEALLKILEDYREWLLQLTICDPACGSGAFLNQALDFLIKEHRYVDEMKAKLLGGGLILSDIENTILERNIYGVDINEESVEIAKLSLWLRTAQPRRKLNDLSKNIKCGNSLIDNKKVAGNKAFKWEEEFREVFSRGGFDVVIGNPPYLRVQGLRENFEKESSFYETSFRSATGRFDIYVLFLEKAFSLIHSTGKISFILPYKFLISDFGAGIRSFLAEKRAVDSILQFGSEMVFADASIYTCIISLSHNNEVIKIKELKPSQILEPFSFEETTYNNLTGEKWNLKAKKVDNLFAKLKTQPLTVKSVFENISQGIVSIGDDIFLMEGEIVGDFFKGYSKKLGSEIIVEATIVKPLLKGEDIKRYAPLNHSYFCLYPHHEKEGKTVPFDENYFQTKFPLAYNYLLPFKEELIEKKIRYKTNPTAWYSLHRSREIQLFEQKKIVTPETSFGGNMTIDHQGYYHNTQVYTLVKKEEFKVDQKYWLAILNSQLFWYYLKNTGAILRGGYFRFKTKYLEPFPLPSIAVNSNDFIAKVDSQLEKAELLKRICQSFKKYFSSSNRLIDVSKKLESWHELEFSDFIKELNKAIKVANKVRAKEAAVMAGENGDAPTVVEVPTLTKKIEFEWMELFEENKKEAQKLQREIEKTDKEIDAMVYELYGLTEEEIEIVENSI